MSLPRSLPIEIQDYIMLFCKGHERADFGIKTVALPVLIPICMSTLAHMLELKEYHTMYCMDGSHTIFIEKKNTEFAKGYVSKMVSETSVQYHWIKIVAF